MFKTKKTYNVAIVGATGIVGESLLDILYSRKFPIENIAPLASKRSAGSQVKFGNDLKIFKKHCSGATCKTVFFSLKKSVSFFKNNQSRRCRSKLRVEGESAFILCLPYP